MNTPRNAQTEAINAAIDDLGGPTKFGAQDQIRALRDLLTVDELPEKIMAVRQDTPDLCLLVVTNHRLMLVGEKGFSRKIALLWDFPWDKVTSVEYTPGMLWHRITVRQGRKKKSFHNMWGGGASKQFEVRKMAEYLRGRIGDQTPVAKDHKTARANIIEDTVRSLGDLNDTGPLGSGPQLKQLPKVLEEDELPESLMDAVYDDRDGLRVSSAMNRMGLLVATDRRLIFVSKEPFHSEKVDSFPYHEISSVESSKGRLRGKITMDVSGRTAIFEGDNQSVQRLANHLQEKITNPVAVPAKSKLDMVKDAILALGFKVNPNIVRQLPDVLEDDELPEKITLAAKPFVGYLIATDRRIMFVGDDAKSRLKTESFSYDTISSVDSSEGLLTAKLVVYVSGIKETLKSISKQDAQEFEEYIQAKIAGYQTN